jgi:hypothetical protein
MVGGQLAGPRLGTELAEASSTVVGSVARSSGKKRIHARAVHQKRTAKKRCNHEHARPPLGRGVPRIVLTARSRMELWPFTLH